MTNIFNVDSYSDNDDLKEKYQALLEQAERMAEALEFVRQSNSEFWMSGDVPMNRMTERVLSSLKQWQEFKK